MNGERDFAYPITVASEIGRKRHSVTFQTRYIAVRSRDKSGPLLCRGVRLLRRLTGREDILRGRCCLPADRLKAGREAESGIIYRVYRPCKRRYRPVLTAEVRFTSPRRYIFAALLLAISILSQFFQITPFAGIHARWRSKFLPSHFPFSLYVFFSLHALIIQKILSFYFLFYLTKFILVQKIF